MTQKRALITGASGQDGLALADFLMRKNYEVLGLALNGCDDSAFRITGCDIRQTGEVKTVLEEFQPDELYNLAAVSNISDCERDPEMALAVNFTAWVEIMEVLARFDSVRKIRVFQASSSEIFGVPAHAPQTEETPFAPRNVYGQTKARAHLATVKFREERGLKASVGILYNHEGPNRGLNFVTRKIASGVAALKAGSKVPLQLGALDVKRDWGHVSDTVEGMWLMLQHSRPDDFILATGRTHTVRQFAEIAFEAADLPLEWQGEGIDERAVCRESGRVLITVNPDFMRAETAGTLVGGATKAMEELGWSPKIPFEDLVGGMVAADLSLLEKTT